MITHAHPEDRVSDRRDGGIAVGLDFTPASESALERARQLAKATGSELLLVHVVADSAVVAVAQPGAIASTVMPAATPEGRAALRCAYFLAEERIEADLDGIATHAIVCAGPPHAALATAAELRCARLLVLGAGARVAPSETLLLGTTGERALRHGSTPVLVARNGAVRPYRHVLLPLQPGGLALRVLRCVAALLPEATYDVVHFVEPGRPHEACSRTHRDAIVASLAGLCAGAGMDLRRTRIRAFVADPREGIRREVGARAPDLVAMGTHARSGIARVVVGSVADHVLHAVTGTDVLVVPPEPGSPPPTIWDDCRSALLGRTAALAGR